MAQTLARNKIKNPFFDMSTTMSLSLVSAALNARFYELNGAQPQFSTAQHTNMSTTTSIDFHKVTTHFQCNPKSIYEQTQMVLLKVMQNSLKVLKPMHSYFSDQPSHTFDY